MKFQHYTISFYNGYYCQLKKSVFNIDVDEESVYKVPCLQILVANDFREYLENTYPDSIFFEIHSKKQLYAAIEIIKNTKQ